MIVTLKFVSNLGFQVQRRPLEPKSKNLHLANNIDDVPNNTYNLLYCIYFVPWTTYHSQVFNQ